MTIDMYTTLLQVIFITCPDKQQQQKKKIIYGHHFISSSRILKTLFKRNTVKHIVGIKYWSPPPWPRFCDKCNKLNKKTSEKLKLLLLKCRTGLCFHTGDLCATEHACHLFTPSSLSIHSSDPSVHLVFNTSRRPAGTLGPLQSTHKHRLRNTET